MSIFFRKTFNVELDDALTYPSAKTVCDAISKQEKNIEFVSIEKPISFKLDNIIYEVTVNMARGGYTLTCKEA